MNAPLHDETRPTEFLAASPILGVPAGSLAFLDLRFAYGQWWPLIDFAVFATIFAFGPRSVTLRCLALPPPM